MRTNRAVYSLIVAIAIVNAVTLAIWWRTSSNSRPTRAHGASPKLPIRWGDRAPPLELRSAEGQTLASPWLEGKSALLEMFDPENDDHLASIFYAAMLAKTYESSGLEVIAISLRQSSRLAQIASDLGVTVAIFADTTSIYHQIGRGRCCGATVLIDATGTVRFATPYLAPASILRSVVERYVRGGAAHSASSTRRDS